MWAHLKKSILQKISYWLSISYKDKKCDFRLFKVGSVNNLLQSYYWAAQKKCILLFLTSFYLSSGQGWFWKRKAIRHLFSTCWFSNRITQKLFTLHLSLGIPCVYRGFRGWMAQIHPSSPFIALHSHWVNGSAFMIQSRAVIMEEK